MEVKLKLYYNILIDKYITFSELIEYFNILSGETLINITNMENIKIYRVKND